MFLQKLIEFNPSGAQTEISTWLSSSSVSPKTLLCHIGTQEMAGRDTVFADIYSPESLKPYHGFGGLYVRIWAIGDPLRLVYGLYLGSKVSKSQSEIRRGVQFTRTRLQNILLELEQPDGAQFTYSAWTDSQARWLGSGSKRGAVRQLDLFVTYKEVVVEPTIDLEPVVHDIKALLNTLPQCIEELSPLREFATQIITRFFLEDLPEHEPLDVGEGAVTETPEVIMSAVPVDWARAESISSMPCGLVSLTQQFQQAVAAMQAGKHIVLLGPPGTGKTELALCLSRTLGVPYDLATATSDWTTFDTIGGYLPEPIIEKSQGSNYLDFSNGIVTQALERRRWLVIDELNRADIDKAFGELFTLLSGNNKRIRLPFKKRIGDQFNNVVLGQPEPDETDVYPIPVPDNWRIIGTMNTFDKASLYQLSFAFLRRFAFIEVPVPPQESYKQILLGAFKEGMVSDTNPLSEAFLPLLESVFTPNPDEGLAKVGLSVGPAIPLDIIRYLKQRCSTVVPSTSETRNEMLLEALGMYLLPQFEGKDRQHQEIAEQIAATLELSSNLALSLSQSLSVWTGYEAK